MEEITISDWDLAEVIDTKEDIVAHIDGALAENDTSFLFEIIAALPRCEGMSQIARELGMSREELYRSLSPAGDPSFETVMKLLDLLGFRLNVEQKSA
jgi:probable addiction module antidote protein